MAFDLPPFKEWVETAASQYDEIAALMAKRLPDVDSQLQVSLKRIEAWQGTIGQLAADADSYLDIAETKALLDRSDDWTDLDRRTKMRAACEKERRLRNYMEYMRENVQRRLSLGQSLLKANARDRHGVHNT